MSELGAGGSRVHGMTFGLTVNAKRDNLSCMLLLADAVLVTAGTVSGSGMPMEVLAVNDGLTVWRT